MQILNFEPWFVALLPKTHALIMSSNLTVHQSVSRVMLHGSRGLGGTSRPDSDIDLSLIVEIPRSLDIARELQEALGTTLNHWQGPVELDLAVVFDIKNCGLKCFAHTMWNEQICRIGGTDCFGLYKTQKGFHGLVTNANIQVRLMYPCLKIWQRS